MRNLVSILFLCACFSINSQINLSDISLKRIPYKKVRAFMQYQMDQGIVTSDELHASYEKNVIPDSLSKQTTEYVLPESFNEVWSAYSKADPRSAWNGHLVHMGVLIDQQRQKVIYPEEDCEYLDTGQVVFLNLKLLRGIVNVAVAFEIVNIDEETNMLEFSYVKGNASVGKQQLIFTENEDGSTQIVHKTYFKSRSKFRDKYLYPFFHKQATNEFHKNMARAIKEHSDQLAQFSRKDTQKLVQSVN